MFVCNLIKIIASYGNASGSDAFAQLFKDYINLLCVCVCVVGQGKVRVASRELRVASRELRVG